MVVAARRRYPQLDVREADAEALPFADNAFDAVVMNFGMLHLGRPELAMAEAYRVLEPGGCFAFTSWTPPKQCVGFGIVPRAIQAHQTTDVPLPPGPEFFRFGVAEECARALTAAGFLEPQTTMLPLSWRLPDPDALFKAMLQGTVRTAAMLREQSLEVLGCIRAAMRSEAAYLIEKGAAGRMVVMLASGAKPGSGLAD